MAREVDFGDLDDRFESSLAAEASADRSPSHLRSAIKAMRTGTHPDVAARVYGVELTPEERLQYVPRPILK